MIGFIVMCLSIHKVSKQRKTYQYTHNNRSNYFGIDIWNTQNVCKEIHTPNIAQKNNTA